MAQAVVLVRVRGGWPCWMRLRLLCCEELLDGTFCSVLLAFPDIYSFEIGCAYDAQPPHPAYCPAIAFVFSSSCLKRREAGLTLFASAVAAKVQAKDY